MAISKINTNSLADSAVTSTKTADANIPVAKLSASGTPSSATFLRGDNTWAAASPATGTEISLAGVTVGDFTGIPSTAKLIFVSVSGVTLSSGHYLLQVGTSGGVVSSGYAGVGSGAGGTNAAGATSQTAGAPSFNFANYTHYWGFFLINRGNNVWQISHSGGNTNYPAGGGGSSVVTLGAALDRVRFTSTSGASFGAGTMNISYL